MVVVVDSSSSTTTTTVGRQKKSCWIEKASFSQLVCSRQLFVGTRDLNANEEVVVEEESESVEVRLEL